MPKDTYHQLPSTKRQRILDALMEEFSHVTYSAASINQIIKTADISRGSFYQYFEDKEDAYMEVLNVIAQRKLALFQSIPQPNSSTQDSVFDHAVELIRQIALWMEREPQLHRIGVLMDLDHSDVIERLRQKNPGLDRYFRDRIVAEQAVGKIDPTLDAHLISDLITLISQHFLRQRFDEHDFERMVEEAKVLYGILKKGTQGEAHV
jgi:TetR/AcrR family transcriptional regulator